MQVKVILSTVLISLALNTSYAQRAKSTASAKKNDKEKTTTASMQEVLQSPAKKGGGSTSGDRSVIDYGHVPLAGEKSYFGEKNDFVTDFVRKYMEMNNRTLSCVQNNSSTPFSLIDNILEQKKMPKELKYLAVIESALNHKAVSHAGAVGPWQLMSGTAQMMGLKVSRKNDERTDWTKSTNAAIKYLDLLYSQLNDWLLVIAAYNSGPVPVQKAIDRTGSHNFWDIKEYLPKETQGHVLAFIATATIFENLGKFISLGSIPVDFKFTKDKDDDLPAVPAPSAEGIAAKNTGVKKEVTPKPAATAPVKPGTTAPATKTVATAAASTAKPATPAPAPKPATSPVTTVAKPTTAAPVAAPTIVAASAPAVTAPAAPKPVAVAFTDDELKNMSILRIEKPISFDLISQELGIDKKLLNRWNPDYELFLYNKYAAPVYKLRFPKDKVDVFLQKKEALLKMMKTM